MVLAAPHVNLNEDRIADPAKMVIHHMPDVALVPCSASASRPAVPRDPASASRPRDAAPPLGLDPRRICKWWCSKAKHGSHCVIPRAQRLDDATNLILKAKMALFKVLEPLFQAAMSPQKGGARDGTERQDGALASAVPAP